MSEAQTPQTRQPGWLGLYQEHWFLAALAIGALARLHFVFLTPGTLDVDVWGSHGAILNQRDLIDYYRNGVFQLNHPPPIAMAMKWLWALGHGAGIPFAILLRLPFALLDAGSLWLILRLLEGHPLRRPIAAAFWLHPLAIVYSSHHGNTDSSVAFFLLASSLCLTRNRALAAGAVLGLGLWIKLPGILAAPALMLTLPTWRQRAGFSAAFGGVALMGYLPAIWLDAEAVVNAVFLYSGLSIQTQSGVTIWGLQNLVPAPTSLPQALRLPYLDLVEFYFQHNTLICLVPISIFAWCRRRERSAIGIAFTIAGSYVLLYGFTSYWAFQYFAWSLPFWLIGSWRFGALASAFATFYVYGLYVWLTGDLLLTGVWRFLALSDWPGWLLAARDVTNLFFLVSGVAMLVGAVRSEIRFWKSREGGAGGLSA